MGGRGSGRPTKPTALKILTGNPGGRPLPENEPEPRGEAVMPAWLLDFPRAVAVWQEVAPRIQAMGLLTDADQETFARYCALTAEHRKDPEAFPASKMARLDSLEARFGMDPSSRARLGGAAAKKPKINPFAKLG